MFSEMMETRQANDQPVPPIIIVDLWLVPSSLVRRLLAIETENNNQVYVTELNSFNLMQVSTKTHKSNQVSVYVTWEIRVQAPTIIDHMSQLACLPTLSHWDPDLHNLPSELLGCIRS
jgi:hypothetical protein